MNQILKLAITDFKIIFRDSSLKSFLFLPILLFVLMIWVVPPLVETYDLLTPYLSLFLVVAIIENTQMFCFISTMVLIDEKETDVAKVYGVVPLTKVEYILSRFLIPYVFTVLLNVIMFAVQPLFVISFGIGFLISCLAALVVPVYVLSINAFVQNRMQGMIYIKAFNMLVLVPIAAFFVPENIKHLFGIFPTHWVFQSIENVTMGNSVILMLTVGFVFFTTLVWLTSKLFIKRHFV
jgi:fluoroquinolone transport system permease protein